MGAQRVLLTGASGYVGGRLLPELKQHAVPLRCVSRHPQRLKSQIGHRIEIVEGDVSDRAAVAHALEDVGTAYYLVHSMSGQHGFADQDRRAAENFLHAAEETGVRRIIYLGGLGADRASLSAHLASRQEVGEILRAGRVETIEFRASVLLGAGSLSFEMVRSLTERLPIMICPRWLETPTQPIATDDAIAYLMAAMDLPTGESRIFEIGGADVTTYGGLIREYARQRGLRRWLVPVPLLSPFLSGLWLGLVTPAEAEVGRHLVEGLRNPTVVRDPAAARAFPEIQPMGVAEAIRRAIATERGSTPPEENSS